LYGTPAHPSLGSVAFTMSHCKVANEGGKNGFDEKSFHMWRADGGKDKHNGFVGIKSMFQGFLLA